FMSFALIALALFGRPAERIIEEDGTTSSAITLVLKPRRKAQPLFWITLGTLMMAVLAGILAHSAFVPRYIAVVFPLFTLLVALGISVLKERRVIAVLLSVLCLGGLLTGYGGNKLPRTQAAPIAAVLNVEAQPGDLVVYCPDQLGPATARLLKVSGLNELTFPRAIGPQLVNWVDYKQVISRTNVGAFAQEILSRLGAGHTLWMVWRDGYPGLGGDCGALNSWFSLLTGPGDTLISPSGAYYERAALTRYPT
ncbi:MAG: hypothetical protein ACRDYC_08900, partial [Acidimicrobiales bacterium]